MNDESYMQLALALAMKGAGKVNPNPLVGAVIVKNSEIIGQGYHEEYGKLHAERNALNDCAKSPFDATMYVLLEPCCHFGKTPPCTEAIIENGISKVVIGALDPNEKVAGRGVEILKNSEIEVVVGVLEAQCKAINKVFFHYITTKQPYVVMKYAMTMDGKISTAAGKSKWVTGEAAREKVHQDRNWYSAIMVGIGTVFTDNPMLTCRIENGRNPIRIICDSSLRTPLDCNIVTTASDIRTIIATTTNDTSRHKAYIEKGCEIIAVPAKNGHVDLKKLMFTLGQMGTDSVLLEGGSMLNFSALESGIVSKVQAYIAPKLFGGSDAKSPVGGKGFEEVWQAVQLKNNTIIQIGEDFLIESEVENPCLQEL
ncbi:MAG: bifunctional diaminohydroxyphosphoribosylaminopyrimidine deaminase/5-amino-6-(5-phosphoribosylamino)uracil reductase RibD [Eubacteriaceae bacterium]